VADAYPTAAIARMEPSGRLLTIQTAGQAMVPWGFALPSGAPLPGRGDEVGLAGGLLTLSRGARAFPLDGDGVDLAVPRGPASVEILRAQIPRLGDDEVAGGSIEQLAGHRLHAALHALAGAIQLREPSDDAVRSAVSGLVGLGTGSTPAGDDMLVGFTAAAFRLARAGLLPADVPRRVAAVLRTISAASTTEVSREMLLHVAGAHASEPLIAVVASLGRGDRSSVDERIAVLRALGGGSGAHMVRGVRALVVAAVG